MGRRLSDLGSVGLLFYFWGVLGFIFLLIFNFFSLLHVLYGFFVVFGYTLLFYREPKRYYLTVFLLCLVEETLVFYLGGGLHGQARNLFQDYVRSLPIFMTHAFLWHDYMTKYDCSYGEILFMAGLHGFFWEMVVSGAISDPVYVLLFGGTPFIFYGLLVIIPVKPVGSVRSTFLRKILLWVYYLLVEILVGITFASLFP